MKIWFCDLTYDQVAISSDVIPTNIGYVASYLISASKYEHDIKLLKYPAKLIDKLENETLPDIFAFSHRMWNARLTCTFAEQIKLRNPDTVIIFGGDNYSLEDHKCQAWLADHPYVDFHVIKEGEVAFQKLIDAVADADGDVDFVKSQNLVGVHCMRPDGSFHIPPPAPRVKDISSFPSPYLSGLLDEFFDGKLVPLITQTRGCPFACTFCGIGTDYHNIVNRASVDRVSEEIAYISRKVNELPGDHVRRDVLFSDTNFGMYKQDLEVARILQDSREKNNWPSHVRACIGKNMKERVLEVGSILKGAMPIATTVQSMDPEVLKNIKRSNIKVDKLMAAAIEAREIGAVGESDVILGLPGDSLERHKDSVGQLVNANVARFALYQLMMLPDNELSTESQRERFKLKTRYRVLARNFGSYKIWGRTFNVVEIEEVCPEGINLPFEDYIKARVFDLVVSIFYNESIFEGVLKLLESRGIKRFAFIEAVERLCDRSEPLAPLFRDFIEETKGELRHDEQELIDETSTNEGIQRLFDGEGGNNVLMYFRVRALMEHYDLLGTMARDAANECLSAADDVSRENIREFTEEVCRLELEFKRGRFDPDLDDTILSFRFDVPRFLKEKDVSDPADYRFPEEREIRFFRTPEVETLVKQNDWVFGTTKVGLVQQITRMGPWKNLWRDYEYH